MTFHYFFFDTYPGLFLQALPFAMGAGAIYGVVRYRKDRQMPIGRKLASCLFVCYMTGLVCLVAGLDLMNMFWYGLFYHADSGTVIRFFSGAFDLTPDLFHHIDAEMAGNFLMFLPFGVLYPLARANSSWKGTAAAGVLAVTVIEAIQPVFGRAFDIDDVILDIAGVIVSASVCMAVKRAIKK